MEDRFIPYRAAEHIEGRKVLVLAPHPDDEVFGCGGAIMRHLALGAAVQVCIVSDGGGELAGEARASYVAQRQQESKTAAAVLGYGEPQFWDWPDREVKYGEQLIGRIADAIDQFGADLVYAPSIREMHPDHRGVAMAAVEAVRRARTGVSLAMYEVGVPQQPNLLLDISDIASRKQEAMRCFGSQLQSQAYDAQVSALNRFRTYTLPKDVTAAEAYSLYSADELRRNLLDLYQPEYQRQHKLGVPAIPEDLPLVSVLIRSVGRPMLQEALDSVALQTYSNIEVVVIDAKGGGHPALGVWCGRFPLRMVEAGKPLSRAQAANLALASVRGSFAIFLDDDDWFDPDHVSSLVSALQAQTAAKVAYAGVRFTNSPNAEQFEVINHAFDTVRLMHGNYIPIHAVLFDRSVIAAGAQFDERLDVYEDWDFWLQVSEMTPFIHVDRVSAGYRKSGNSGVNPATQHAAVQHARELIYEKWKQRWSGHDFNSLIDYAVHIQDEHVKGLRDSLNEQQRGLSSQHEEIVRLDGALNETKHTLTLAEKQLQEANRRLQEKERQLVNAHALAQERDLQLQQRAAQVHEILTSTSWRFSAPVRVLGARLRRVKTLAHCLSPLWRDPSKIYPTFLRLRHAKEVGGMPAVKQLLLQLPGEVSFNDIWLNQYRASFTPAMEKLMRESIARMQPAPLISVLVPTYNTPEDVLRQTIESVINQIYPCWQLCIVDDASPQPHVKRVLQEYAAQDGRIKVEICERNGGVSAATNRALAMAEGQMCALLDHDDLLEKQALFRLAESIIAEDPDMIYSDEVMLSEDGSEVVNHVYRPSFSPERLRNHPYIVHLVAFRTSLLRKIGGLDVSLAISQDYDLILRASEQAEKIVHIPEVLYCWRQRKSSAGHQMQSNVMDVSRKVLERHLQRCGEAGTVKDGLQFNYFEVRYPLAADLRVAIIIPTKNHGELVRQCVESIERTVKHVAYDIVVIDHQSTDPASIAYFQKIKAQHIVMRYEGPFNFSVINNWAVAHLEREYTHYLFCNNDIEAIHEGWLERMLELCQKPDVGMVGAKLYYPDGRTIQHAGVCVGMHGMAEHYGKFMDIKLPDGSSHPGYHGTLIANSEMSAVTAACALMRRDAFEKVGGYDESLAVGFGDVDLCLKTYTAGYRILFCPQAELIHHESFTRGKSTVDPHPEDSARFAKKWRHFLDKGDPYYNINLFLNSTKWEVGQPMALHLHVGRRLYRKPAKASAQPVEVIAMDLNEIEEAA